MANNVVLPQPPDPETDPAGYLMSIYAVRERAKLVLDRTKQNTLTNFNVDMGKFNDTVEYVVSIIKRDYAPSYHKIPPHGRWQHFSDAGHSRLDALLDTWTSDSALSKETITKRLLDLILVSVLLDAGAGNTWKYTSLESGNVLNRSEGLGIASLEMFTRGWFSSDPATEPCRVDGPALRSLSVEKMAQGFQISDDNIMDGLEGRVGILIRLGEALQNEEYFGPDQRPGNILDYLLAHPTTHHSPSRQAHPLIPLPTLWTTLTTSLSPIWPQTRTKIAGRSIGDAWPCSSLPPSPSPSATAWETIAPFHKLTQWLTYSLMEPMRRVLGAEFPGVELMTGLPEYRNGGLLVDLGLLTLKPEQRKRGMANNRPESTSAVEVGEEAVPSFLADDDVIVEWRAVTVGMLDELHRAINDALGLSGEQRLSLAQVLEAGTWKAGREIAASRRPKFNGPPIRVISDGTVF